MAMITAVFDASGAQDDQDHVVVSGFIASPNAWISFADEWQDRLGSPDAVFHATKYRNQLQGAYETDSLVRDLIRMIQERAQARVTYVVSVKNFPNLTAEVRREFHLTAYIYAARSCVALVRRWAAFRGIEWDKIHFVFERGDLGWREFRSLMEEEGLPTPSFLPKTDVFDKEGRLSENRHVPLQAADFIAHETFRGLKYPDRDNPVLRDLESIPGPRDQLSNDGVEELRRRLRQFRESVLRGVQPVSRILQSRS